MINYYKLFELINSAALSSKSITEEGTFIFSNEVDATVLKKECEKNSIKYDNASSKNELTLEVDDVKFFKDLGSFKIQFPEFVRQGNLKDYYCYFSKENGRIIIFETKDVYKSYFFSPLEENFRKEILFEASNVFYWEKIFELIQNNLADETFNDNSFSILSYKKGKYIFSYSAYEKKFNEQNLMETFHLFQNTLEKIKLYPMIMKNRCVERIGKENNSTLLCFISELEVICEKSELDLEIFINNIDFDSYINKYNEKICGLISQTREIIEKILSNIFTLPLTYAGAIFSFDKLEDSSFGFFIFISMLIYTLLSCGFLIYAIMDTSLLKKSLSKEIKYFTNNSEVLIENTKSDIKTINNRFTAIKIISVLLILVFIGLIVFLGIKFFLR